METSTLSTSAGARFDEDEREDDAKESEKRRFNVMLRAVYSEFLCTIIFFSPIFALLSNAHLQGWESSVTVLTAAIVTSLQATACIFSFSSISGAVFNPAISFALWLTGKLSNRKLVLFVIAQLFGSVFAMFLIWCTFTSPEENGLYHAIAVIVPPGADLARVFATEFWCTFLLTYVAFHNAYEDAETQKKAAMSVKTYSDTTGLTLFTSTPQSKSGFAPFAIGFTLFGLATWGGSSGVSMNPCRWLGPALFFGNSDYLYLYALGEFSGAACAGLLCDLVYNLGKGKEEVGASGAGGRLTVVGDINKPLLSK